MILREIKLEKSHICICTLFKIGPLVRCVFRLSRPLCHDKLCSLQWSIDVSLVSLRRVGRTLILIYWRPLSDTALTHHDESMHSQASFDLPSAPALGPLDDVGTSLIIQNLICQSFTLRRQPQTVTALRTTMADLLLKTEFC